MLFKMMKKQYFRPITEGTELITQTTILSGSPTAGGKSVSGGIFAGEINSGNASQGM